MVTKKISWDQYSRASLLPIRLVACGEVVKEAGVHLHEGLKHVVDESDYRLVPMLLTYPDIEKV